jgi:hypothetical protein
MRRKRLYTRRGMEDFAYIVAGVILGLGLLAGLAIVVFGVQWVSSLVTETWYDLIYRWRGVRAERSLRKRSS